MLNEQKAGPVSSSDGAVNVARTDNQGAAVVTQAHGAYAEGGGRKNIYFSYSAARAMTEVQAGMVGNIVWNPPDSGVILSLLKWSGQVQVTSATTFGMLLCYAAQATTPTGLTAIDSAGNTFLSAASPGDGKAHAYAACTLAVAPVAVMNLFHNTAAIAGNGVDNMSGDLEGLFSIPPGYATCFAALNNVVSAAGFTGTLTWEEIPV